MTSFPVRNAAPPSATLLRFLRAQASGKPFFTPNHGPCGCISANAAISRSRTSSPSRSMTTCSATLPLALESAFFPSLWSTPQRSNRDSPKPDFFISSPPHIPVPPSFQWPLQPRRHTFSSSPPSNRERDPAADNRVQGWKGWNRLWGRGRRGRPGQGLQPNDLPPLAGLLDGESSLQHSLGRVVRPANELRLRCTEFDEHGNVTLVNGEFKKSELIAKYGLPPRDLRKIDSSMLPSILIRPHAILINLLHLRVLIKHNRVLVFDAYGSTDSYTQSLFMYDLEGKLRSPETASSHLSNPGSLPYEFRALEAVLISVTAGLEAEFEGVREPVVRVLRELEEDIDRDKLRHLLIYSKKLGTFEQKARLVRDAIDDLLEADDDLASMYLTEKATSGVERDEDDHTEVEMLLESYHKVADEIVQASGNLVSNIRNTEEIVKAILDANRNSLMLLDLKFSIGTLGIGGGTFVAALYGMNLKNFIEESDVGFWGVSAWCTVFSVGVCLYGLRKLRRVQRVSMWGGERGDTVRGKGGWASLGPQSLGSGNAVASAAPTAAVVGGGGVADGAIKLGLGKGPAGVAKAVRHGAAKPVDAVAVVPSVPNEARRGRQHGHGQGPPAKKGV